MRPSSPSSESKLTELTTTNICKIHKQPFSMICLHLGCHSCYKLICVKCKKQKHYQHPNRVINLVDFYNMLGTNKMDFIENSLGLFLVNIKNKLIYVSNFRIFILEKQSMLIQNARSIHATIFKILEEKTLIKTHMENINDEGQIQNTDKLISSLQQMKRFISFNPIQNVLRVNSQKVGSLKVELQKYCDATKSVINDIRQYLVKIVEVMIQQQLDDDDIEYIEHEDVDEKVFNINVKKLNHVEMNEKQARYKVEDLQEMFNSLLKFELQKHEQNVENDVQKLQQEIKIKQEIVHKIRKRSTSKFMKNCSQSDQIKETNTSPGRNTGSQYNSSSGHNDYQTDIEFQKISLETPKIKDARSYQQQRNIGKNINRNIPIPKVKSITDRANMSPKVSNSGVKVGGMNVPNKKSPLEFPKNRNQTPKSQIKHKNQLVKDLIPNFANEESDQKNQNSQNQTNLECQQVDERKEDISLNIQTSFVSSVHKGKKSEKSEQRPKKIDPKLSQLTLNNKKLANQKKELQVKIEKLQKEIKQLKQKQANSKQQQQLNVKNVKQLSAVKRKNEDLSKRNEQLNVKNEELKTNIQEISNKNQELNKQIVEISNNNQELNKQLKESSKKIEGLNKQFSDISKKFEEVNKKNNELNKRNKDLQKKIEEMLRKNEQIIIRDQQLAGKLVEQKNIHQKQMKQRLNDLNSQKEKKISSLDQKIKEMSDQNQKLRLKNGQAQNILAQKQILISQLQHSFESQENQLKSLQEQKYNLQAELTQNKVLISDMEFKISQMQQQIKENNKVLKEKQQIIKKNHQEINSLSSMKHELNQQIKQKTLELEANESLNRQMESLIEQKTQQTNQAKQKLTQAEHQLQEQMKIIKDFLNSQQSAQMEIQTLKKQIIAQNLTLQSNHSLIKDLQHKTNYLEQQIKEISSDQNTKIKTLHETLRYLELNFDQTKILLVNKQNQLNQSQKRLSETIQKIQILQFDKENLKNNYQRQVQSLKDQQQFIQQRQEQKIWAKDQQVEKLLYSNKKLILQIQGLKQQLQTIQKSLQTSHKSILSLQNQANVVKDDLEKSQKENGALNDKLQKSEEQLQKAKSSERQRMKENQKIQAQMMQQFQFYKKKYQEQKQRNEQNKPIDIKNNIPLIKYNELKQWYEIAIKKNQQFKDEINFLKEEKKKYVHQYELKLKQVTQLNALLIQKCETNFENQKRDAVKRQTTGAPSNQSLNKSIQKSSSLQNKHSQLRQIIQIITVDMQILQEKVRQNTVIEKVYLKELDRKRTENRKLRQENQEYRMRERKQNGVRTERNFEKVPSSKYLDTKDCKVYYATGSAVSEAKVSEGGSSVVSTKQISSFRDNFVSKSESESLRSSQSMNI